MTTYTAFKPPPNNSFSFQPILDGNTCNAVAWFNADGQRWYINVTAVDGTLLFNLPMIGSPTGFSLQRLTWANGIAEGTTIDSHGFDFMATVMLTVSGCSPEEFNGLFPAFITGDTTFTYKLASNPAGITADGTDEAVKLGFVSQDFNIGAGYLTTSTLVFREASQMFEVTP